MSLWHTSSAMRWPERLKNTNRPFYTLKTWAVLTNKGQYPSVHPDPWVEAKLALLTKLTTADLMWVLSGRGDVTRMVIFLHTGALPLCLVHANWRITRGYKLLIITLQLSRMNQELWPCGPCCCMTILVLFPAPRMERFYHACMHAALHCIWPFVLVKSHCRTQLQNNWHIPPTLQCPEA